METNIYLIRHAQSNPSASLNNAEWPLSAVGQTQAEKLSDLLEPLGIEILFSSPFVRCLQTVQPFAGKVGLNINVKDDLRERLVAKEIVDDFHQLWCQSWDDFNFALPGCESSLDAQARFVAAVLDIHGRHPAKTIGISAHGYVIGLFLNYVDPAFGRVQAEGLRNPEVMRIVAGNRLYRDPEFRLPDLDDIATDYTETPVTGKTWPEPGS